MLTGATVSSLLLEEMRADALIENGVGCVDMEASIVFSAAASIQRRAAALFYVSDVVGSEQFYEPMGQKSKKRIQSARKEMAQVLLEFIGRGRP